MQLLYTGAASYNTMQTDPNLSLGGYISNTVLPNNSLNNLFSDFSYQTVKERRAETKCIILKNTLGIAITQLLFGYQYPAGANFKLEVAFVALNPSTPTIVEKIPNAQGTPYFATFAEAKVEPSASIDNSINVGAIAIAASIAIWLRRTITSDLVIPTFTSVNDELTWWKANSAPGADQTKTIQLLLKYTVNQ